MTVGNNLSYTHSLQGKIFSKVGKKGEPHVAIGVKNIGVVTANILTTEPVFEYYAVYSLDSLENKTSYHIGYALERSETLLGVFTGGIEYRYNFGSTLFEWDGFSSHFGVSYNTGKRAKMYFMVSPSPVESDDKSPVFYSIGGSFSENIFKKFAKTVALQDQLENEMTIVDHRLKSIEARERALADMISVDFLNQLENSFIDRELIEKKMDKETKGLVKDALAHMQFGLEHYYKGEFNSALEEDKVVVSLLPTFPMGYVRIGSIYYQLGDNYKAKKSWQKASDLQPKNTSLVEYLERMVAKASYQDIEDLYLSNSPSDASLSDSDSELESLNVAAKNKVEKSRDKGVENE